MTNHFVRGAVSGVGAVCMVAAFAELATIVTRRVDTPPEHSLE